MTKSRAVWEAHYYEVDDDIVVVGGNARPAGRHWPSIYFSTNRIVIEGGDDDPANGHTMKFAVKVADAMNRAKIKPQS